MATITKPAERVDEWIVEARLPARQIEFEQTRPPGRTTPIRVTNTDPEARESKLRELFEFLESILEVKPVLLRAAGAVSIKASPSEMVRITNHPLVRRVEPNRRRRR
ncbi:MAG: hypothetical protein ACKV2U_23705 [Bryobacteraceae bacterium]